MIEDLKKAKIDDVICYLNEMSKKELKFLFKHYSTIIDNRNLATLNDHVWFFAIKQTRIDRDAQEEKKHY